MNAEEKELKQYIAAFHLYSKQNAANDTVDTILVYRKDCHFCHDQFRFFKNKVKAEFYQYGEDIRLKINNPDYEKFRDIIKRMYIMEKDSAEAKKLVKKYNLQIPGVPAWIDIDGSLINTGALGEEGIKSVFCTEGVCLRKKSDST